VHERLEWACLESIADWLVDVLSGASLHGLDLASLARPHCGFLGGGHGD